MSPDSARRHYQIVAPPGLERATAAELLALGAADVQHTAGSVTCSGSLELGYRANLELRSAARVRLRLARFRVASAARLAAGARRVDWPAYLGAGERVAIQATLHAATLPSADLAARITGEAITARTRARISGPGSGGAGAGAAGAGQRIDLRLVRDVCTLSIDMSGAGLDRRGYHQETGSAPLREHLAAALLERAGWTPERALVDPMCGSGTLPIEACLRALRIAPGHHRAFPFERWPCCAPAAWRQLQAAAARQVAATPPALIWASDRNAGQLGVTRRNAARAGVLAHLRLERRAVADLEPPAPTGLLFVNPPYGRRLRERRQLEPLYAELGQLITSRWRAWDAAVLSADARLERHLGLAAAEAVPFRHGGLACRLLLIAGGAG